MAISFVSAETAIQNSGTTITINKPSGVVAGDLMVAAFIVSASGVPAITPPAGWDSRGNAQATNTKMATFTKIAGPSEPSSYAFTTDLTITEGSGAIAAYRAGGAIIIGNNAFTSGATSNPTVAPSVVTEQPNAKLLCAFMAISLGSGVTGMTQRVVVDNTSRDVGIFDQDIPSPGATGSRTYTGSGDGHGFSLSIEEESGGSRIRMMI